MIAALYSHLTTPFSSLRDISKASGHSCHSKQTGILLSSGAAAVKTELPGTCNRQRHRETHHDSVKGKKIPPVCWWLLKRAHPNSWYSMNMHLHKRTKKLKGELAGFSIHTKSYTDFFTFFKKIMEIWDGPAKVVILKPTMSMILPHDFQLHSPQILKILPNYSLWRL